MKILFDTSVIVEIDRKNKPVLALVKNLISKNADLYISIVTLSEILTGCYLREDYEKSMAEAKRILSQFQWKEVDSNIAEKTAKFMSQLIKKGKPIEYPDVVIAATFDIIEGDKLLTLNKEHFNFISELKGGVFSPDELLNKIFTK